MVRACTMTATNHDGYKVYHDGHSNENVKNQRHTSKKSPNSRRIHTVFRKQVCGRRSHCLWPSWCVAVIVEPQWCVSLFQPEAQKSRLSASSDDYVLDQLCICEEKLLKLIEELETSGRDVEQLMQQMEDEEVNTFTLTCDVTHSC